MIFQDNDTYVTNNYFISNDGSNAAIPAQNAETPGFENQGNFSGVLYSFLTLIRKLEFCEFVDHLS